MIKAFIWLLGIVIVVLSLAIIAKPKLAQSLSERLNETGYALSAWARIIIGLILLLIADTRHWYILFNALGVLVLLSGAYMLQIGFERGKELAVKISRGNENFLRISGVIGVILGLMLLSAR
ncbi:hypothetical protein ACJJI5_02245 [Microbulbifer sp. EKSA008]|uniref:hypothetical protein n=1 Tax=unclassified Microbulbifer TaxID=2619833 RepID=UPI0024AE77AE|nr:hypothetical protein [Microbulbifer sp. VAAF005]WHI44988.1 hypothetical protein P0078_14745 [Microbulbifer sp. VAAF005]